MSENRSTKLFEEKQIRTVWDEKEEKWYFSIVDVVSVLTDQPDFYNCCALIETVLSPQRTAPQGTATNRKPYF